MPFQFNFSDADFEHINGAVVGTALVANVNERIGDLWPDKGFSPVCQVRNAIRT